jgi:ribonuclease T1
VHQSVVKLALTGLVVLTSLAWSGVMAKEMVQPSVSASVSVDQLPPQGRTTYQRILQGGPFPYEKDGVVFGNRERMLPLEKRGYYREYTVKTPGSRDRGARRIVCGGPATTPNACYYTADHYASFRKIVP